MLLVTRAAIDRLQQLIEEHPEDPIVRIGVRDLDETRLSFTITLDTTAQPDDEVQEIAGITVAVDGTSVQRMDGITLDYAESGGFRFLHPDEPNTIRLTLPMLN